MMTPADKAIQQIEALVALITQCDFGWSGSPESNVLEIISFDPHENFDSAIHKKIITIMANAADEYRLKLLLMGAELATSPIQEQALRLGYFQDGQHVRRNPIIYVDSASDTLYK